MKLTFRLKGGEGSGNFAHAGRPGMQGGSAPGPESFITNETTQDSTMFNHENLPTDPEAKNFILHLMDQGWEARSEKTIGDINKGTIILTKRSRVGRTPIHIRYNPSMQRYNVKVANFSESAKSFSSPDDTLRYAKRLLNDKHFFS